MVIGGTVSRIKIFRLRSKQAGQYSPQSAKSPMAAAQAPYSFAHFDAELYDSSDSAESHPEATPLDTQDRGCCHFVKIPQPAW